jgi:hypothetical protein
MIFCFMIIIRGAQARDKVGKRSSSSRTIPQLIGKLSIPFDYAFVNRGGPIVGLKLSPRRGADVEACRSMSLEDGADGITWPFAMTGSMIIA